MTWTNPPLRLYHGCDQLSAKRIATPTYPMAHSINLSRCSAFTDFGRGFYTTTLLAQAQNWAHIRCARLGHGRAAPAPIPKVLQFDIDRALLTKLETLCFIREGQASAPNPSDYWQFVSHCRNLLGPHRAIAGRSYYDLVCGPVSLWPQSHVIKDCDQFSFHTVVALAILPTPVII